MKRSEHERVTLQQAAILYRKFDFNAPCTININVDDHGKQVRLGVPTISHAVNFLNDKGYDITVDNFDDFLDWLHL